MNVKGAGVQSNQENGLPPDLPPLEIWAEKNEAMLWQAAYNDKVIPALISCEQKK